MNAGRAATSEADRAKTNYERNLAINIDTLMCTVVP